MKAITKFQALDGSEFDSEDACRSYESLCAEISDIMVSLPEVKICGAGHFQHEASTVLRIQRALVEIFARLHPSLNDHHVEWARRAVVPAGMTLIGRDIDDCGEAPLRAAWHRLMRMDRQFREYEQPYYAIQADRASSS